MEPYFHLGFKNQVILDFLQNRHGIPISLSTLKRTNTKLENPGPALSHSLLHFLIAFYFFIRVWFLMKTHTSIIFICFIPFTGTMNSINWPAPKVWVFIAQLVEHCSANAEAMGSNPVEAPKTFFGLNLRLPKSQSQLR